MIIWTIVTGVKDPQAASHWIRTVMVTEQLKYCDTFLTFCEKRTAIQKYVKIHGQVLHLHWYLTRYLYQVHEVNTQIEGVLARPCVRLSSPKLRITI